MQMLMLVEKRRNSKGNLGCEKSIDIKTEFNFLFGHQLAM